MLALWGAGPARGGDTTADFLGITHTGAQTVFSVWAPHAQSVAVIGDFNNWKAFQGDQLVRQADSGIWRLAKQRSRPSGAYQFLINGNLHRRDPYARAVSPDGKNSLAYDPYAFDWQNDQSPAPPIEDLVIYEMHIGTFADPKPQDGRPATFHDAIKRLDTLKDLGINCVELMPIHEFQGMHSWGYNPCDLFAVEQTYGGPDGFKTFVQACHQRGIAVHLDIVHNHYGPENLDLLQFDGTGSAADGGIYFYSGPGINLTPWGPRVKFEDPQVRQFIKDNVIMWLDEYRVDGFRWDSPSNIRAYNEGAVDIPAGRTMLEELNAFIRNRYPRCISIAEDSMDLGQFHASWDFDFHHSVVAQLALDNDAARDLTTLAHALVMRPASMWRVIYVDNHDEAGKINNQTRIANDMDPEHPGSDIVRRKCGLGAVLTFTGPGIPLLFMGNEMMEEGPFHDDRPLDWSKWSKNAGLVALHRDLIRLRRNLSGLGNALKGLESDIPLRDNESKQLVYWRWRAEEPDAKMVIAMNLTGKNVETAVAFPHAGPWVNVLNSDWARYGGATQKETREPFQLPAQNPKAQVALAPYSARIFAAAPGKPAAKMVQAAAPAKAPPAPAKSAFSMYASLNVVGSFNAWQKTQTPLVLVRDYEWEGLVNFTNQPDTSFRLSANADGRVYWGETYLTAKDLPLRTTLVRLGTNVCLKGPLDGTYRFLFNEDRLSLEIEAAEAPPPAPAREIRIWTDLRGRTLQARLVRVEQDKAIVEKADGQQLQLPLAGLSEKDVAYLRALGR